MNRFVLWGTIALCSGVIYFDWLQIDSSIVQGFMMFIVNTKFRLYNSSGIIYAFGLFFESLLAILSALLYFSSPVYTVIFWVYFSSINKFAVEDPEFFSRYGKYSVYFGYSLGSILLGLYTQFNNVLLLRYGAFWIFINMSAVAYGLAYEQSAQEFDLDRFVIICMVCICAGCSMVEKSVFVIFPCVIISFGLLVYETIALFIRLVRSSLHHI